MSYADKKDERPGDVTVIWRDGEIIKRTPWGKVTHLPPIAPLPGSIEVDVTALAKKKAA